MAPQVSDWAVGGRNLLKSMQAQAVHSGFSWAHALQKESPLGGCAARVANLGGGGLSGSRRRPKATLTADPERDQKIVCILAEVCPASSGFTGIKDAATTSGEKFHAPNDHQETDSFRRTGLRTKFFIRRGSRSRDKLFAIRWSSLTPDADEKRSILDVDKQTL
jgi:hypothetical protein